MSPYIQEEYFDDLAERTLFKHTADFIEQYKSTPTYDALYVSLSNDNSISEAVDKSIDNLVGKLKGLEKNATLEWLLDSTEKFCQQKALFNALRNSLSIADGTDKAKTWGAIPDILTKALSVSFDASVGHDYLEDAEKRFEYYHRKEDKIPFDLDYFNRITDGGVGRKKMHMIYAGCVDENTLIKIRIRRKET